MSKKPKTKGSRTILWWVMWIVMTIVSFFLAAWLWTPIIASQFGSIHQNRNAVLWVTAVFGTWMVILVPLIVVMYMKVDKVYGLRRKNKTLNRK
ncbi:MAG: hypothetical protein HYZ84_02120 [Candidatus Omnitrophica bacterium]|nr:hypothetical protein [Candidatus Omnitrophota bacterium]